MCLSFNPLCLTLWSISAVAGAEGPDRIFVGGIPYYFSEEQMRELLESFGYAPFGLTIFLSIIFFYFVSNSWLFLMFY